MNQLQGDSLDQNWESGQPTLRNRVTLGPFSPLMMGVVHPVLFSGWCRDGAGQGGGPPAEVGTTQGSALEPPCQLCHLQSDLGPGRDGTPWVTTPAAAVDNTYFGGEDHFQSF